MEKSWQGHLATPLLFIAYYREGSLPSKEISSLHIPRLTTSTFSSVSNDVGRSCSLITTPGIGSKEAKPLKRSRNRIALFDAGNETNCKVPLWEDRKQ